MKLNFFFLTIFFTYNSVYASCVQLGNFVDAEETCCRLLGQEAFVAINSVCVPRPEGCGMKEAVLVNNQVCCQGLNNVEGVCKDPSPVDNFLQTQSCETNPNSCSGGKSCLPQRYEDIFSGPAETEAETQSLTASQGLLEAEGVGDPRPVGQFCIKNSQCESYNCVSNACKITKICRFAEVGEVPENGICSEGLELDPVTGKCIIIPPPPASPISGSTDPVVNQCRFNFPAEMKAKAEYAIAQTRAMEWFLNSMDTEYDCLYQARYLKNVGAQFLARRRELLTLFNTGMKKIDDDKIILLASKDPQTNPNASVTIHGTTLTNKQLAGRLTSGVDALQIMFDRNLVFQAYEKEMNILVSLTHQRIKALTDRFDAGEAGWGDHNERVIRIPKETSITADGLTVNYEVQSYKRPLPPWVPFYSQSEREAGSCRGGGTLDFGRRKIWKRWDRQFAFNSRIFNDANIKADLAKIIFPAHTAAGAELALKAEAKLPTGRLLHAIDYVSNANDFPKVRTSLQSYFSGLKANAALSAFNHEPELLPLEAKDCADGSSAGACSKYADFLDSIARIGYAQTFAYSTHTRWEYKFFFNGDSWRRRLFSTWKENLNYLVGYYASMVRYRDQQNICLTKSGDYAEGLVDNSLAGINEGAQNYYVGVEYSAPISGQSNSQSSGPVFNTQSSFEFQANLLKSLSWNSQSSNPKTITAASGSGTGVLSSAGTATLAKRVNSAKDISSAVRNDKSSISKSSSSGLSGTGGSTGAASSSSGSSNSTSTTQAGKASLMDEMMDKANGKSTSDADANKGLVKGSGSSADGLGANIGAAGGISAGAGSGFAAGLGADPNASKDPTGMSDEEKDVMMANFERTKSRYDTKEDDSLFTIINKTYVRNLDKILKKKPSSTPE